MSAVRRSKRPLRSPLRALLVTSVLGLGFWGYARLDSHAGLTGSPMIHRLAPALDLTTDKGQQFSLSALRGHVVLVYFGYTSCPDVCPTTLADLARVSHKLGSLNRTTDIVFVTLDPSHDTTTILRDYLAAFNPQFIGLTGSSASIATAARNWGISWWRVPNHTNFIDHTSVVGLVGPHGHLLARYGVNQIGDISSIVHDVRQAAHAA